MCSVCRSEPATHPLQAHIHQRSHSDLQTILVPLKEVKNPRANLQDSSPALRMTDGALNHKRRNLKIAIVYLHEQNRFEVWLGEPTESSAILIE